MRKVCTTLALAILTPFAWVTAQDDQGPAEKATNTTKKAAQATGQTIKHGAQATGSAISRGTKATERTVGKTLERTGSKIREAGATTKHVVRHRTTHTTAKKSATSEGSPSPGVSPASSPEKNAATRPSPTPGTEANPSAIAGNLTKSDSAVGAAVSGTLRPTQQVGVSYLTHRRFAMPAVVARGQPAPYPYTRSTHAVAHLPSGASGLPLYFESVPCFRLPSWRRLQFAICCARLRELRRDRFRYPVQSPLSFLMTG